MGDFMFGPATAQRYNLRNRRPQRGAGTGILGRAIGAAVGNPSPFIDAAITVGGSVADTVGTITAGKITELKNLT